MVRSDKDSLLDQIWQKIAKRMKRMISRLFFGDTEYRCWLILHILGKHKFKYVC